MIDYNLSTFAFQSHPDVKIKKKFNIMEMKFRLNDYCSLWSMRKANS